MTAHVDAVNLTLTPASLPLRRWTARDQMPHGRQIMTYFPILSPSMLITYELSHQDIWEQVSRRSGRCRPERFRWLVTFGRERVLSSIGIVSGAQSPVLYLSLLKKNELCHFHTDCINDFEKHGSRVGGSSVDVPSGRWQFQRVLPGFAAELANRCSKILGTPLIYVFRLLEYLETSYDISRVISSCFPFSRETPSLSMVSGSDILFARGCLLSTV